MKIYGLVLMNGFPIGARVLVDGEVQAIVKQFFPEGSSSYLFPHYKLDFVGGDKNVAVSIKRVGVTELPFGVTNPDTLALPFCACGRTFDRCDGSRKGCKRTS
jgi:hypothetical protein